MEAALAGRRPGEGRVTGVPWSEIRPAGNSPIPSAAFHKILVQAGRALEERRTAGTLRVHAILLLAAGMIDRAIAELSEAAELSPADAVVWSDLAAAHLQRSAARSDPYEIVLALSAANRAVRHDSGLLSARFNRALALAHLSLRTAAAREWQHVLRSERDPLWLREAQEHAAALARPAGSPDWKASLQAVEKAVELGHLGDVGKIVASSPQRFREHVEEKLLPAWAMAESERRGPAARKLLDLARIIGQGLVAANNERMAAETIAQIDQLGTVDRRRWEQVRSGLVDYSEGLALAQHGDFSGALAHFQAARKTLDEQGSPFAGWAAFQTALCLYQLLEYKQARVVLHTLTQNPTLQKYKALQGRALVVVGLMDTIEGNPGASLVVYNAALANFRSLDERPSVARLGSLLASALDSLGQRAEAWRNLHPALIEPVTLDQPKTRSVICEVASFMSREQGDFEIALQFQDELLRNAYAPYAAVEALRGRVGLLAALGRTAEASRDLSQAWRVLERIPDLHSRRSLEGDLWLAEAELASQTSPQETLEALGKAIPFLRDSAYRYRLVEALERRAVAEDALGRLDDAERDLAAAIAELERQRENIEPREERIAYLDQARAVFDRMIWFQLERRRSPIEALRVSEQAKARVLLDWILAHPGGHPGPQRLSRFMPGPVDLESLVNSLPVGTAAFEYAALPDNLIIWVLRRGEEPQGKVIGLGAAALADRVQHLHRTLRKGQSHAFRRAAQDLYETLIAPVENALVPGERLVFVPDGALHALPFAALIDRRSGRYLVQDHVITVAPSLRIFAASLRRDAAFAPHPGLRALVIAAPEHDRELHPSLDRLEAAATETAVVQAFPGSRVLRGHSATRRAFLRSAGGFAIVHFGGHSLVNSERPLFSYMLFAEDPRDPARGVLHSRDILGQRFERTQLAVLASCGTAVGKISRTEGVESLARPFLAAGVPAVVASLWDVDDQSTSEFFARFYGKLRQRFDVAAALQATQIEAIEHGSPKTGSPRSWGAFEVIGSGARAGHSCFR